MSDEATGGEEAFAAPLGGGVVVAEREAGVYDVGSVDDFVDDTITGLVVGSTAIVLIRQGGAFYALPDRCTHQRFPLNDGELLDGRIRCMHHGATFDLQTGRPTLPAVVKIKLFSVEDVDGRVLVTLQQR
ncbi:MAG TPA: Rieske 2Fe-2S domain-containing protein [Trueperaceae bacterium]|nr:Rieske 2Fe-2S domain-containing protein [Trueperaceae bacterium]